MRVAREIAVLVTGAALLAAGLAAAAPAAAAEDVPELVKDIRIGSNGSALHSTAAAGGLLFFSADDGAHGRELWISDGTAAGTKMVKDIRSGSPGSTPIELSGFGDVVLFRANDGINGFELWRSDGTEAGTFLVKDIRPGGDSFGPFSSWPDLLLGRYQEPVVLGGHLYFTADDGTHGDELWKTDGTAGGTAMVADVFAGPSASIPENLTPLGDALFFTAGNADGRWLFRTGGTAEGTVRFTEPLGIGDFGRAGNLLYIDGFHFGAGHEPWVSGGTQESTSLLKNINPSGDSMHAPMAIHDLDGTAFFPATDGVNGFELWKSDGTAGGTVLVKDINPGEGSSVLELPVMRRLGDALLFQVDIGGFDGSGLWRTDGTADGTFLLKALSIGDGPRHMVTFDGSLYLQAEDDAHGAELWRSDGTIPGTELVADIWTGESGGEPAGSSPDWLTVVGDTLFFSASDGEHGKELWKLSAPAAPGPPEESPPDETPPDETPPEETAPEQTAPSGTPPSPAAPPDGGLGDETPPEDTPPLDSAPPELKLAGKKVQRFRRAIVVKASCQGEACTAIATAKVKLGGKAKASAARARALKLKPVRKQLAAGQTARLKLKARPKARKAIAAALKRGRKAVANVKVAVTDAAGNSNSARRKVRLRR